MQDGQWHFDFKDWEAAFELFYRKKQADSEYCLVISTHWMTSGYWIERNAKTDEFATVYRSIKAAQELENRIRTRGQEWVLDRQRRDSASLGGLVV